PIRWRYSNTGSRVGGVLDPRPIGELMRWFHFNGRRVLVFTVGTLIALGGIAYATIPDLSGLISACYSGTSGALRVIDITAGQKCSATEKTLSWNQTGPAGPQGVKGDTGAAGAQGLKGDTGAAGAQGLKGDTGAAGAQGPAGPPGPAGTGGSLHGVAEFINSGIFTVPTGVTSVLVEIWGGGGGGGGSCRNLDTVNRFEG